MRVVASLLTFAALAACSAETGDSRVVDAAPHADEGPAVYFANIADGDVVSSPFRVVFGLHGMGVAPALIDHPNTGHHHLIINERLQGEELLYAIPADDNHIHFGGGQTETVLDLPPGEHTLQLVLGDYQHMVFDNPVWSDIITITVE